MTRLLTFSSLFPNPEQPRHGLFVYERLRQLLATGRVGATVIAPVPWFPLRSARFGRYAAYARVPRIEQRDGLEIHHPRYASIPKIGMSAAPLMMALATLPLARRIFRQDAFEVIDAHYFYPDGVAAALLGHWLHVPVTITARGTDLNLIARYAVPRRWIRWAAGRAGGLVTVSAALRDRLVALGTAGDRVSVLPNGVDLARFRPLERAAIRTALGITSPLLLSVGNLVPEKRHELAIAALVHIPEAMLMFAGAGPARAGLERAAREAGVSQRVRFLGSVPQSDLVEYYNAADALLLLSTREGMPNVVLEALACGTPVVATAVGGVPEVVDAPPAGRLVADRSPRGVSAAVNGLLAEPPLRSATRAHATRFSWNTATDGYMELLERVLARRQYEVTT